jgi:hypothetical protein
MADATAGRRPGYPDTATGAQWHKDGGRRAGEPEITPSAKDKPFTPAQQEPDRETHDLTAFSGQLISLLGIRMKLPASQPAYSPQNHQGTIRTQIAGRLCLG